jgi:hypothetical protein
MERPNQDASMLHCRIGSETMFVILSGVLCREGPMQLAGTTWILTAKKRLLR